MEEPTESTREPSRWALFRDVAVFQGKLIIDGLRDLVLVPVSLAAALIGVLTEPRNPGRRFYSVVALGRRSERWINLFGHQPPLGTEHPAGSMDVILSQVEAIVLGLRLVENVLGKVGVDGEGRDAWARKAKGGRRRVVLEPPALATVVVDDVALDIKSHYWYGGGGEYT